MPKKNSASITQNNNNNKTLRPRIWTEHYPLKKENMYELNFLNILNKNFSKSSLITKQVTELMDKLNPLSSEIDHLPLTS